MKTWTKPVLVKDTMELSQYSIAACIDKYYEVTITCDSAAGFGHPGIFNSVYTWYLKIPAADYEQYGTSTSGLRHYIQNANQYGDYTSSQTHDNWYAFHDTFLVGEPIVINAS
jgi:hypothetical protein